MGVTEAFESLFGLESFESSSSDEMSEIGTASPKAEVTKVEIKKEENEEHDEEVPLSVILENWLLDENTLNIQHKHDLTTFSFDETPF